MSSGNAERELRERFRELREAERGTAPPFRAFWEATVARSRVSPQRKPALLTLAAASLVLAASAALLYRFAQDEPARGAAPQLLSTSLTAPLSISAWTSPTATLLRTPGIELLGSPHTLNPSILDRLTSTPAQPKGA